MLWHGTLRVYTLAAICLFAKACRIAGSPERLSSRSFSLSILSSAAAVNAATSSLLVRLVVSSPITTRIFSNSCQTWSKASSEPISNVPLATSNLSEQARSRDNADRTSLPCLLSRMVGILDWLDTGVTGLFCPVFCVDIISPLTIIEHKASSASRSA